MPTYTNTGSSTQRFNQVDFLPDVAVEVSYYFKNKPSWLSLTDDEPYAKVCELLATITSAPSSSVSIGSWGNVIVYNATNDVISVSLNGDSANAFPVLAGTKELFVNNDSELPNISFINTLKVETLTGTGSVYVWGRN